MKRIAVMALRAVLALVLATPMVLAQPNGGKPTNVDEESIDLDPGTVFGNRERK